MTDKQNDVVDQMLGMTDDIKGNQGFDLPERIDDEQTLALVNLHNRMLAVEQLLDAIASDQAKLIRRLDRAGLKG